MARKKMGAEGILSKRTGAQALYQVVGDPRFDNMLDGLVPKLPKKVKLSTTPAAPNSGPFEAVLYRVTAAQRKALVDEAMRRAKAKGRGKLDASEVLREVLDEWMAER